MNLEVPNFSEATERESTVDSSRYSFSLQYSDQQNKPPRDETKFLPEFSGDNDIEIGSFNIRNSDPEKLDRALQELDEKLYLSEQKPNSSGGSESSSDKLDKALQELDEKLYLSDKKTNSSGGSESSSDKLDSNTKTPVRAKQIGDYLSSNFSDIDFDKNNRLDLDELKFLGGFINSASRFTIENYYALKSLSNDDNLSEKGISKKDVSMLYGKERPKISTEDAVGTVLDGIGRSTSSILKGTAVAGFGSAIFCPPCTVPVTGVAFVGSTLGIAGGTLYSLNRQLKQVDEIYQPNFSTAGRF